jgi:hypothetical protein
MHEGAGEPSVPSFHGSKWPICCGNSSSATAGPGCRGRVGRSSCPRLLRHPRRGGPMAEVVRLPASTVALQDAVDAFLEHHDVAHSTRRVYRASLGGLAATFGPGPPLATFPVRSWPDGFAPATVPRRRRPGTGSWRPSAPRSAGGAAVAGWRATQPRGWSAAATGQTARGRSPAASWRPCSSTVTCRCCWPAPGTPRSVP